MKNKKLYQDRDWLYQKYKIEKLSSAEIGKICNVGSQTILNQMNRFGIKARSVSEALKGRKRLPFSEKTKRKMSKAHKGIPLTEKTKRKMSEARKGEKNPMWGKHLSEDAKRKLSEMTKKAMQSEAIRKKMIDNHADVNGRNNPSWKGGLSFEPYSSEFNNQLKYEIRKRDNYTCQFPKCGKKENGKTHDCHHINYIKKDNKPNNFTTLCHPCHMKTNTNREYWENYFNINQEKTKWKY